jgi:hypothetical protein
MREVAETGLLLVPDYVHVGPGFREVRQDIEQSINRQLVQPALMLSAPGAAQLRSVWSFARVHDAEPGTARVLDVRLALKLELEAERRKIRQTVECKLDVHRTSHFLVAQLDYVGGG